MGVLITTSRGYHGLSFPPYASADVARNTYTPSHVNLYLACRYQQSVHHIAALSCSVFRCLTRHLRLYPIKCKRSSVDVLMPDITGGMYILNRIRSSVSRGAYSSVPTLPHRETTNINNDQKLTRSARTCSRRFLQALPWYPLTLWHQASCHDVGVASTDRSSRPHAIRR